MRKSADYDRDVSQLNPVHVIIAGVISAVVFVARLVAVVNFGDPANKRGGGGWGGGTVGAAAVPHAN